MTEKDKPSEHVVSTSIDERPDVFSQQQQPATSRIRIEKSELLAYMSGVARRKSPYPPAEELEKYESLAPGLAKVIMDRIDAESEHRRGIETHMARSFARGPLYAIIIFILGLLTLAVMSALGADTAATAGIIALFAAVMGIYGFGDRASAQYMKNLASKYLPGVHLKKSKDETNDKNG